MDKLMSKRIKQIIKNKEKRFGMVPDGHYEKSHIESKRENRNLLKKELKKIKKR